MVTLEVVAAVALQEAAAESGGGGADDYKPQDSEETDDEESKSTSGKSRDVLSGQNYGGDVANMLDILDFLDEDERREIILGYLADNVVPKMVLCPEDEDSPSKRPQHHRATESPI